MVIDETLAKVFVFGHQSLGMDGEVVLFDDADGRDDARYDDND